MNQLIRTLLGATALLLFFFVSGAAATEEPPEATPPAEAAATPTIDRLAAPPTVPSPTQADEGAQLFWLHCQPCHGDQGQGLTEEWRNQYPEEDRNCWNSGCHGPRPYEDGFILPTAVPAVIGENTLSGYQNLGQLFGYIRVTMPFEYPGVLEDEEYLAITAFLASSHGAWDGERLTTENVAQVNLRPPPEDAPRSDPQNETSPLSPSTRMQTTELFFVFVWGGVLVVIALAAGLLWRRFKRL